MSKPEIYNAATRQRVIVFLAKQELAGIYDISYALTIASDVTWQLLLDLQKRKLVERRGEFYALTPKGRGKYLSEVAK